MRALALVLTMAISAGASLAGEPESLKVTSEIAWSPTLYSTPDVASLGIAVSSTFADELLELTGGTRLIGGALVPPVGISAFVRASVNAQEGVWRPSLGLEIEATTATNAAIDKNVPSSSLIGVTASEDAQNTVRVALVGAPLRFQWEHLFVAGPSLRLGTPLAIGDVGERIYLTVALVELGWRL